jgi:hypothetical protein
MALREGDILSFADASRDIDAVPAPREHGRQRHGKRGICFDEEHAHAGRLRWWGEKQT